MSDAKPEQTVLILGAGASRASDFELPTLQGFFGSDLSALLPQLRAFLTWFYPGVPPEQLNVEELLAFLDLADARLSDWTTSPRPTSYDGSSYRYQDLIEYVGERLSIRPNATCERHVRLFDGFGPKITVISLNYDLIGDYALRDSDRRLLGRYAEDHPYSRVGKLKHLLNSTEGGFGGSRPPFLVEGEYEYGFYLKLHGSLDWLTCSAIGCVNKTRFYSLTFEKNPDRTAPGQPCRQCGAPMKVFIVPPIASKPRDQQGPMRLLWSVAFERLRHAARAAVVGVSFAPSDVALRYLVRQAAELRGVPIDLDIVNPSERDRKTACLLFAPLATVREFRTLDEYLSVGR